MTKYGIEHDLPKSDYKVTMFYNEGYVTFYFSSIYSHRKFEEGFEANREQLTESLSNRFKMRFHLSSLFCDIQLYRKVEGRGFCIDINGRIVQWLKDLEFDGQLIKYQPSSEK